MPRGKKRTTVKDLKKLRVSIQEDEKQDAKLLMLENDKEPELKNYFKQELHEYLPYRFEQETKDESPTHSQQLSKQLSTQNQNPPKHSN